MPRELYVLLAPTALGPVRLLPAKSLMELATHLQRRK